MNQPPDDLDREYHRAAAADDSRPSERVRAAILGHAHKVAVQPHGQVSVPGVDLSTPAANDSRWRWRSVAGLAAIGFTGVLVVLMYRGNPNPEPAVAARVESDQPLPADEPLQAPQKAIAPREPAATARQREAAPEPAREELERSTALADAPAVPAAAAPASGIAVDAATVAGEVGSAARASVELAGTAPAAEPAVPAAANAIISQYFPAALDSEEAGQQYWVLLGRDGSVLRSGQRNTTSQSELAGFLESSFAGIRTDEVQMREFINQRGRTLSIAYVFLAEGSPAP